MARFVITDPSEQSTIFEITGSTVNIGRADTNDLVLKHPSISRHHARLTVLPGDLTLLIDLGSMNGIFINGKQVQEHRLVDQDHISLGMYEMRYEAARQRELQVETGSSAAANVGSLTSPEMLEASLRGQSTSELRVELTVDERLRLLERENNLLKLLLSVGKTLSAALSPDEVMERVMELVFHMDNVERGFVMLRDEKGGFKPAVLLYKDEKAKREKRGVALSTMLMDRVLEERLPLLIYDVASDQRFSMSESLRLSGVRSAMCAPLIYKDKVMGIFYVDCFSKSFGFSKDELNIFSVIAAEAAISFDNARSHEELAKRVIERQALERFMSSSIVEKILANPDQVHLGGENQLVSVLFADVRGFTSMSEHLEPERVVELLNEFFAEMTDLIFENGGTLDKYLGDGLMALFGAPISKHDDAVRCVKTAAEMQRSMAQLNRLWESRGLAPLRVGIGINSGQVTAGNIGSSKRMDYTVIGDAVNLASRLCANAAPDQVLISESTFRRLEGKFPAQRLEPIRVKGKEAPVEIYEIVWRDSVADQAPVPVSA